METITAARSATRTPFRIQPIPADLLDRIRAAGHDDLGNPLVPTTDDAGGSPLRCCLRPAAPGDRLCLIAYRPFTRPGPYAETGPVFIHADPCAGYADTGAYPPGYRDWPTMVFRPYRYDGVIAYDAIQMGKGASAEEVIAGVFADPAIEFIHTRNLYAGCYMFCISRPGA
jgi:Protein of unknown function (DUF1203)